MRNFLKDTKGGIAIQFALSAMVVVISAGAAVDYSRTTNARAEMQQIIDAAALTAAIEYRENGSDWDKALKAANEHVRANVLRARATDHEAPVFRLENNTIYASVAAEKKSTMSSIFGYESFPFEVDSVVKLPDYPIEVAMVLDNTFSMTKDNKIGALKSTSQDFVDTLTNGQINDVKIAIVPFSQYVNVGEEHRNADWIDVEDKISVTPGKCRYQRKVIREVNCRTVYKKQPARYIPPKCTAAKFRDGILIKAEKCKKGYWKKAKTTKRRVCDKIRGPKVKVCSPAQTKVEKWTGCVASREHPLNIADKDYDKTPVPGKGGLSCPQKITPLTDSVKDLKKSLSDMKVTQYGATYIPSGITWGHRTLTPGAPFDEAYTDATREKKQGRRFMVIMTDGENIASPRYSRNVLSSKQRVGLHTGNDVALADKYMLEACENAKADNIQVYTVSFGTDVNAKTRDLLTKCATRPDFFFNANSNADLVSSFEAIGDSITAIHIAQ